MTHNESRCCIALVIGIPGSGKTRFIQQLLRSIDSYNASLECSNELAEMDLSGRIGDHLSSPVVAIVAAVRSNRKICPYLISYDQLASLELQEQMSKMGSWKSFRESIIEAAREFVWHVVNSTLEKRELQLGRSNHETLLQKIIEDNTLICCSSLSDHLVLVDDNLYYRSMRYKWFQVAREVGTGFCQLYIDCPLTVALERNLARKEKVPDTVIETMSSKIEEPDPLKYFWEKHSIVLEQTGALQISSRVLDFIRDALEDPARPLENNEEMKEQSRVICSKNMIHQVDRALRRIIGEKIKEARGSSNQCPKQLARRLAAGRESILSRARSGHFRFPQELTEALESEQDGIGSALVLYLMPFMEAEIAACDTCA